MNTLFASIDFCWFTVQITLMHAMLMLEAKGRLCGRQRLPKPPHAAAIARRWRRVITLVAVAAAVAFFTVSWTAFSVPGRHDKPHILNIAKETSTDSISAPSIDYTCIASADTTALNGDIGSLTFGVDVSDEATFDLQASYKRLIWTLDNYSGAAGEAGALLHPGLDSTRIENHISLFRGYSGPFDPVSTSDSSFDGTASGTGQEADWGVVLTNAISEGGSPVNFGPFRFPAAPSGNSVFSVTSGVNIRPDMKGMDAPAVSFGRANASNATELTLWPVIARPLTFAANPIGSRHTNDLIESTLGLDSVNLYYRRNHSHLRAVASQRSITLPVYAEGRSATKLDNQQNTFAAAPAVIFKASSSSQTSLATYELVPTSITSGSGSIVGNTVLLNPGSGAVVQFNVVIVVHDSLAAPANDGIEEVNGGLTVTSNQGLSGAFALPAYGTGFGAPGTGSQLGTRIASGSNTNIGNETSFGTAISVANGINNDFKPYSNNILSAGFTTGTPLANGDTPIMVGTVSLAVSGTGGSLTVQFLPDLQTSGTPGNIYDQIFENHGTTYALNGIGTSQDGSTTNGIDATTVSIQIIPEPAPHCLVVLGSLVFLIRRRNAKPDARGRY